MPVPIPLDGAALQKMLRRQTSSLAVSDEARAAKKLRDDLKQSPTAVSDAARYAKELRDDLLQQDAHSAQVMGRGRSRLDSAGRKGGGAHSTC